MPEFLRGRRADGTLDHARDRNVRIKVFLSRTQPNERDVCATRGFRVAFIDGFPLAGNDQLRVVVEGALARRCYDGCWR